MSTPPPAGAPRRNWVGIRFRCHGAYLRVVVPPEGSKTSVRCPVCGRQVDVLRGPGGSDRSFFEIDA